MIRMKGLFKPILYILDKSAFSRKFLLVGLIFLIPLLLALYMIVNQVHEQINFLAKERLGVAYSQSIRELIDDVQQHRGMTNAYLSGDKSFGNKLIEKREKISGDFQKITQLQVKMPLSAQAEKQLNASLSEWGELQSGAGRFTVSDSFRRHTLLIGQLLLLNRSIGVESNLAIDPKLDTNYLISNLNEVLLPTIELMGQARGKGAGIFAKKAITEQDRLDIMLLAKELERNSQTFGFGFQIVYQQSLVFSQNLSAGSEAVSGQMNGLLTILDKDILRASAISQDSQTYFKTTTDMIQGAYVFYDQGMKLLDETLQQRLSRQENIERVIVVFLILLLGLLFYVFYALHLSISENVKKLQKATEAVAKGNLCASITIASHDEMAAIGADFNKMTNSLCSLVSLLHSNIDDLATSSEEMTSSSDQSAQAAEHIAQNIIRVADGAKAQLECIKASEQMVQQITHSMEEISNHISSVVSTAEKTVDTAQIGGNVIQKTIEKMDHIFQTVNQSSELVEALNSRSEQIETIIHTIAEIASQTNLLALNASIEAARAGEHGRGFAVVASEVGKLADQSQAAAKQIGMLIEQIQENTRSVVTFMRNGTEEVSNGVTIVQEAGSAFQDIVAKVEQVYHKIGDISRPMERVVQDSRMIVDAVYQSDALGQDIAEKTESISAAAQEQSASMEQIAVASQTLAKLAETTRETVSKFTV